MPCVWAWGRRQELALVPQWQQVQGAAVAHWTREKGPFVGLACRHDYQPSCYPHTL